MMAAARIDPPRTLPGEVRCVHDMLTGTCAVCKGLPDVPELMPWDSHSTVAADETVNSPVGFRIEKTGRCVRCDAPLAVGTLVTWSDTRGGILGPCCDPEDDL